MKKFCLLGCFAGILCISQVAMVEARSNEPEKQSSPGLLCVNFSAKYKPYYYTWDEEDVGVNEDGWIHEIEMKADVKYGNFVITPQFTIYGGEVDYDGGTWNDQEVSSKTDYNGWNAELTAGYQFFLTKNFSITPYIGGGYEYWKRSIENQNEPFTIGYAEKWKYWYGKIGMKPEYRVGNYYVFGDVYAKYNFNIRNEVDFFDVTVEPDNDWGYGIEAGVGVDNFLKKELKAEFSVFYEHDNFDKSSTEYSEVADDFVFQPESNRDLYGFKIGVRF